MKIYFYIKNIFLIILLAGCSSSVKFTKENDKLPAGKDKITPPAEISEVETSSSKIDSEISYANYPTLKTEIGTASFYADKFHGRLTANGEIYDMHGLSAAHPSLPLGTLIRVTHIGNGKSLVIKINDRMPKHPSRIIDLSLGTAKKLDMVSDGLAEVKIEVFKMGDNKYKKQH